jgi:hypothetical protein
VKIHLRVDKYGIPLAIDVSPTNVHWPWQCCQAVYEGHRPGAAPTRRSRVAGSGPHSSGSQGGCHRTPSCRR